MKIMQTISQFIDYISIERRLSSLTVSAYTIDLNSFREFASQNQIENIEDVDSMLIRQWEMKLLEEDKLSGRSVCRKLAALRSWNKYLRKQSIVKQDFFVKVTAPKIQHQLPVFFREAEMEKLKDTPSLFPETFEGIRDSLIIELFYETGIRRAELVGLCDNSFDFENNTVKVLGKRNKLSPPWHPIVAKPLATEAKSSSFQELARDLAEGKRPASPPLWLLAQSSDI